ncbi:amino acid ABC transporter permease [Microbacterium sp. CFH 31415]|uniref:amino acid ABC transporter permease n=1 Tax=Microbacterium sp. CFH 31415 TaxID=2921732 RepID=UPI001F12ACDD|nr:amino acid ABC transporter permease [Microbacterium sp. CFH 31415]MCH6230826.1 amino acid ABC transporter permease [Microbacterium sp. CFH 31415]
MRATAREAIQASIEAPPQVHPARHRWRWVAVVIAALIIAQVLLSMMTNEAFRWGTFLEYLFSAQILDGLAVTLMLTAISMTLGIVLGTVVAVWRMSSNRVLSGFAWFFAWLFRGVPTLVQLVFFYNFAALYPTISIGVPFLEPWVSWDTNTLITPMLAAILGLGLNEAAYMSEIIRGGLMSVPRGQVEAARGLGMTPWQAFSRIVMPQATRVITPATFGQMIGMLKYTSLVSVLSIGDLLYNAEQIFSRNFQPIPLLMVASVWYLFCTSVLMLAQYFIERRINRGHRPVVVTRSRVEEKP